MVPDRNERLDRVWPDREEAWLVPAELHEPRRQGPQDRVGPGDIPERQLKEPERELVQDSIDLLPISVESSVPCSAAQRASSTRPKWASTSAFTQRAAPA